jgi:hypothetical protein
MLRKTGRALNKPGISKRSIFTNNSSDIFGYSVDPSDATTWFHLEPDDGFGFNRSDVFFDPELQRTSAVTVRVTLSLAWSEDSNVWASGKRANKGMVFAEINCKTEQWRWLREAYAFNDTKVNLKPFDRAIVDQIPWGKMNVHSQVFRP